jgi:hypothetical protein
MSNETKTPNTRITYLDGHTDEVCVTMWQRCQAETHAKAKGWGSALDAVVKLNAYAAYVRCRQLGSTTLPFEQWADTVVSVVDMNNDATDAETAETYSGDVLQYTATSGDDAPDFFDQWDSGSFGELSCILAARFGGTPWQWRREQVPQEADWGTCTALLQAEAEETENARRKAR